MRMNRIVLLVIGILFASASQIACSSSDDTGAGGSGGGAGGSAGGGTGQAGGGGAPATFMAVMPCTTESAYQAGTMVQFPDPATGNFAYAPKCLKVTAGATVTFAGSFTAHPLEPSLDIGDVTDNPIPSKSSGESTTVTFPKRGFYAYYCAFHGTGDGMFMAGVVWVQ